MAKFALHIPDALIAQTVSFPDCPSVLNRFFTVCPDTTLLGRVRLSQGIRWLGGIYIILRKAAKLSAGDTPRQKTSHARTTGF